MRISTSKAHQPISRAEEFTTHGALSGRAPYGQTFGPWDSGRLPREYVESFQRATFAAFSFATPLGWITDGQWHIPDVRYSVTSSRHLTQVRHGAAISGLPIAGEVAA